MKISIILPFFKKLEGFKLATNLSPAYGHKDVEMIVAMDHPQDEEAVVGWVNDRQSKVIVNDIPHPWRSPTRAINVGIRHATGDYVIVMSPESVLITSANYLLDLIDRQEKDSPFFAVGKVFFINPDTLLDGLDESRYTMGYGFIMAKRCYFEMIYGFDERRNGYGGDDDDIRLRFKRMGLRLVMDDEIRVAHIAHGSTDRPHRIEFEPYGQDIEIPGQENWGRDFSRIAFDYTKQ